MRESELRDPEQLSLGGSLTRSSISLIGSVMLILTNGLRGRSTPMSYRGDVHRGIEKNRLASPFTNTSWSTETRYTGKTCSSRTLRRCGWRIRRNDQKTSQDAIPERSSFSSVDEVLSFHVRNGTIAHRSAGPRFALPIGETTYKG